MVFIPLPMVVALLLALLLLMLRERLFEAPSGRVFGLLLVVYCIELVLIGLRWGYGIMYLLPLQAMLAAGWCPLAWLAFRSLSSDQPLWTWRKDWLHALPVIAVVLCMSLWPLPIDLVMMSTYLIYAIVLTRLAMRGPDALRMVRLSSVRISYLALCVTAGLLFCFTFVDVLISWDIRFNQSQYSATIVALANVPSILILGLAAVAGGQGRSLEEAVEAPVEELAIADSDEREARELMPKLEELLVQRALYKDPELNLQRMARKCGVPARRVSRAVNLLTGQNVSQWVNEQRVKAACELLQQTDQSVTAVMFDVGFMTKSNFNREFKRITGTSPSGWRER